MVEMIVLKRFIKDKQLFLDRWVNIGGFPLHTVRDLCFTWRKTRKADSQKKKKNQTHTFQSSIFYILNRKIKRFPFTKPHLPSSKMP